MNQGARISSRTWLTERKHEQVTSVVKLASEKAAGHNKESVDAPYPSGEDCQNMSRDHGWYTHDIVDADWFVRYVRT